MRLKPLLKKVAKKSVLGQRLYRVYRRSQQAKGYPAWGSILARSQAYWDQARQAAGGGPKVLIASLGGIPSSVIMDSLLGCALTLRGAEVHFLLCDSFLPACLLCEIGLMQPRELSTKGAQNYFCKHCFHFGESVFKPLGLKLHRYSEYVRPEEIQGLERKFSGLDFGNLYQFESEGIPLGEHAMAGALRYFACSNLDGLPYGEAVLRLYLKASFLSYYAVRRLLRTYDFAAVCCINGIYVPQGIVASLARAANCRVATWNVAYRKRSFLFSHQDTYHHTLMEEPVSEWQDMAFSKNQEDEIMEYLTSRRRGGRDWIVFQDRNPNEDLALIAKALPGIDFSKPCIGMLTNVAWDAQLHYPANAFPDMIDWVLKTLRYFQKWPDLQLVVRIHPAEVSGDIPSRQPLLEEIHQAFPRLPKNIFIIPPQSRISTYAVMEACNAVLIYGTKTGVELTSLGIPVVVAGEAWIRNKGITMDAQSAEHYFQILDQLPLSERMSQEVTQRARKYAYHFFFRRMVPVTQIAPTGGDPQFVVQIGSIEELLPGRGKGLDIICEGILKDKPFVYPAEILGDGREFN